MARKHHVRKHKNESGWITAAGVALVILGVLGLLALESTATAFFTIFGIVLSASGISLIIAGILMKGKNTEIPALGIGILYLVVGLIIAIFPSSVVSFLALILGVYFVISGIAKMAGWYKDEDSRAIMVLSGILDFLFGTLILIGWPASSEVLMGILISLELIFMGFGLMSMKE